ncbi:MAG: VWA domain-containing protein [Myxococcota bacterium]
MGSVNAYLPLWFLGLALGLAACSDVRLEYPEVPVDSAAVDDQLTVTGSFCTSPAESVTYPVKVMFIVDGSGSQQFSDQNRQRVIAVEQTINALVGEASVAFKIIVFNASVSATPATGTDPVFTSDLDALTPALDRLAEADTVTDYQGALAVAYSELRRDIANTYDSDPSALGRTKYVLIFISDGLPDPQCQIGLGNDFDPNFPPGTCAPAAAGNINCLCEDLDYLRCILEAGTCGDGTLCRADGDCNGGGCTGQPSCGVDSNGNGVCIVDDDTSCYQTEDAATLFGGLANLGLAAGGDYNQPYQVLAQVEQIMQLGETYELGQIRVHAGLVLDPDADPAVIAIFGDPAQAVPLMQQVAAIGEGQYMEFYGGDDIDFLSIDFASIKQQRVIRAFFADNSALHLTEQGRAVDTDFDGLTDLEERTIRSDPLAADSDGDGYGDALEWWRRGFGFDPSDPCHPPLDDTLGTSLYRDASTCNPTAPAQNCQRLYGGYRDDDEDGLNNCEERALGTHPGEPDSDRDSIPDRVDYLAGLDPARWSYDADDDQDGLANGEEVAWHLNPRIAQNELEMRDRYRYDRPEVSRTLSGQRCYDFAARHIRLAPSAISDDLALGAGYNEVRLFIVEGMADTLASQPLVRVACLRPRYVPPSLKEPPSGEMVLTEADFKYLPSAANPISLTDPFDPALDCRTLE